MKAAAACAGAAVVRPVKAAGPSTRVFDVAKYGAVGDGKVLDSPGYSGLSMRLLLTPDGRRYWCGVERNIW